MKQFNKKFILITIFLCIFLFTGCSLGNSNKNNMKENNEVEITPNTKAGDKQSKKPPTPSSVQPVANKKLMIYSINVETGDTEPATALVPKEDKVTPELIVNTVVEALEDQSVNVGVEDVTQKDDAVIVNFKNDQAPSNAGDPYEGPILNAIAQSLLDNLDDYTKVIFRIDGKAYVTDNIELGINKPYLEDN